MSANLRRAQPFCSWCGTADDLHVDHIVPISQGGAEYDVANLRIKSVAAMGEAAGDASAQSVASLRLTERDPSYLLYKHGRKQGVIR